MKKLTIYEAKDGTRFDRLQECSEYEQLIDDVKQIMSALPSRPEDSNFEGYIQHNKESFMQVKNNLLLKMKGKIDHHWIDETMQKEDAHPSWVGRILGDYNIRPFSSAWYRIQCTDKNYREYNQVYLVEHPKETPDICLNQTT